MTEEVAKQDQGNKPKKEKKRELLEITDACKNCGQSLLLDQQFCQGCGAKRMYNRLNWSNLFEDFADRFLNVENHFFRTFVALFKRPEDVIDGYVNGTRKKYISAFGYFTIAVTIAGIYAFILQQWFLDDMIAAQSSLMPEQEMPQWQIEFNKKIFEYTFKYTTLVYFLTIPLMAIMSRTVFWNYKKYNFVEHIVIYLYGYSQVAMVSAVLQLVFIKVHFMLLAISVLSIFWNIGYFTYVLKRIFKLRLDQIILKTLLFILLGGVLIFGLGIIIGIIGTMSGWFDGFNEIIKQQQEIQKAIRDSVQSDTAKMLIETVKDTLR